MINRIKELGWSALWVLPLVGLLLVIGLPFYTVWVLWYNTPQARYERLSEDEKELWVYKALGASERTMKETRAEIQYRSSGKLFPINSTACVLLYNMEQAGNIKSRYNDEGTVPLLYKVTRSGMKRRQELTNADSAEIPAGLIAQPT